MTPQPLTLDGLLALCEKATPGPYTAHEGTFDGEVSHPGGHLLITDSRNVNYLAALSPEVVAALVRAVQAGDAMRAEPHGCRFCDSGKLRKPDDPDKGHDNDCGFMRFDAARATIDAAMRGKP